jgi:hypothetical protein
MGEATRRMQAGQFPNQHNNFNQPQQITVDLKDTPPTSCSCGCVLFQQLIMCYTVSALLSPTGKELLAQRPVLVCVECKKELVGMGG